MGAASNLAVVLVAASAGAAGALECHSKREFGSYCHSGVEAFQCAPKTVLCLDRDEVILGASYQRSKEDAAWRWVSQHLLIRRGWFLFEDSLVKLQEGKPTETVLRLGDTLAMGFAHDRFDAAVRSETVGPALRKAKRRVRRVAAGALAR